MSRRPAILVSSVLGLAAGVGVGLVLALLYSRDLLVAYTFSALIYGLIGAVACGLAAALFSLVLSPRWTVRIAGGGGIAAALFLLLGYWGNKWLLAGLPFHAVKSILFDAGAFLFSAAVGIGIAWIFSKGSGGGGETASRQETKRIAAVMTALLAVPLLLTFLVIPGGKREGGAGGERLSVLLISIDALRADHLGCYGYDRDTSPFIDRLAAEGVRIEHAFCPVPSTSPSHASMLTGLPPQSHRVRENAYPLDEDLVTLAEVFSREGYATAGFTTNVLLGSRFGFGQGFDTYVESGHVEKIGSWNTGLLFQSLILKEMIDKFRYRFRGGEDQTLLSARLWLEKIGDRPFFLFFHLLDPHTPYTPREPFRSRFPADERRTDGSLWNESGKNPAELARAESLYDGEIASVDAKLEDLFRALEEAGRDRNLLVVFTADHGENLGDHRPWFAHQDVYDSVLRVPLFFHLPGELPAGCAVDDLVDNRDLVPTILSIAGLSALDGVEGRDLLPLLRGGGGEGRWFLAYHGKRYALRTSENKLMIDFRTGERRFFDLVDDPGERVNILAGREEEAAGLEERMIAEIERIEKDDYFRLEETSRMEGLDRETKERLRLLGYLD